MNDFKFKLKKTYLCLENKKIIIAILLTFNVIMSLYKYDLPNLNFFEFMLYNIVNSYYLFMLFMIILTILFSNLQRKKQNLGLILRFKTKKDYIGYIIENFIFNVCIVFTINFFIIIIFSLFSYRGNYSFGNMPYYNISFFTYLIFFYIRMTTILMIYGVIVILLNKNFGKLASLCGSLFFCFNLFVSIGDIVIENILDMKWIGSAYLSLNQYPTFMTEVFCSALYIFALMIIVYGLIYIYMRNKHDVG